MLFSHQKNKFRPRRNREEVCEFGEECEFGEDKIHNNSMPRSRTYTAFNNTCSYSTPNASFKLPQVIPRLPPFCCYSTPNASFKPSTTSGYAQLKVSFIKVSFKYTGGSTSGIKSHLWTYGDGATCQKYWHPSHIY